MMNSALSENKKPRFNNRGFFATPEEQAAQPRPTYIFLRTIINFVQDTLQKYNIFHIDI